MRSIIVCYYVAVLTAVLMLAGPTSAMETRSVLWGDLEPGPHAIGFETVEKFDYSRVFLDKYDYDGNPREGETARPIQICIWYPATATPETKSMVYGEYAFPVPDDSRFYPVLSALQVREAGYLMAMLGGSRALLADMMNLKTEAIKNAQRAEGSFPLVIYHPDIGGAFAENAALCEFLASNGFIVATSHSFGTTDLPITSAPADLETLIRDREFVYAYMRDYPSVDLANPGVMGLGLGGLSALLMQMRNTDIEAVMVLDGIHSYSNGITMATDFPAYSAARLDVPLLHVYASDHDSLDLSLFDSFIYSTRMAFGLSGSDGGDITQYALAGALLADSTGERLKPVSDRYSLISRLVHGFFDVHLRGQDISTTILAEFIGEKTAPQENITITYHEGEKPPPTEAQFVEMIQANNIDRAVEIYDALKESRPGYVFFQEATLNAVGYRLLQGNQLEDARKVFKMNSEAYPNSANVWDSYADACLANGDADTAILCYQKVLEVLPADSAVGPGVREILMNNATQGLEELQK